MPLPAASLSLHVHSAVQSRPKRAMLVRMSAESLDALDNGPPITFDFGPAPGIHIADAFFPVRPMQECSPHELYLRAASAAKPMPPLKLYANVIGKFMVERQLGDKATDKVRQQTIVAKQQHLERQAILLDQPPIPPKNPKRKLPGSGTVVVNKTAPPKLPSKPNPDVRRRLVHCLAISPRLADDAVRMVGGAAISLSARDDLLALLEDVAEQAPTRKGDKSPRPWALKSQSWTEVRPYEWPKLTENERTNMARQARMALKALKIPESDPAWDNVRYRPPASVPALPPMATNKSTTATKKSAPRAKAEIQVKDESTKAAPRANPIKRAQAASPDPAKIVASRRVPGSGYQAKKSPQPSTSVTEKSDTVDPRPPPKPKPSITDGSHARKTIPAVPSKPMKKEDESDREYDRQREKREREREKQREERVRVEEMREKAKQKEREAERERRQKERRDEIELEKRRREKDRLPKERPAVPTFKRKQDTEETLDDAPSKPSLPKRRKLDDGTSSSKTRDADLSKKQSSPVPRFGTKRDPSSPQPSVSSQDKRAHKSERPSKASGSTKSRRRSPIYTSSEDEDEGEIPQPRKRKPSPPSVSDRSNSSDLAQSEKASRRHRATRGTYPPATDHAALRALYQSQYAAYLGSFSKVVAQKRKIEAMLNGDSEGEVDLMDPEELAELSIEYKTLRAELEHIRSIYTGPAGGSRSD